MCKLLGRWSCLSWPPWSLPSNCAAKEAVKTGGQHLRQSWAHRKKPGKTPAHQARRLFTGGRLRQGSLLQMQMVGTGCAKMQEESFAYPNFWMRNKQTRSRVSRSLCPGYPEMMSLTSTRRRVPGRLDLPRNMSAFGRHEQRRWVSSTPFPQLLLAPHPTALPIDCKFTGTQDAAEMTQALTNVVEAIERSESVREGTSPLADTAPAALADQDSQMEVEATGGPGALKAGQQQPPAARAPQPGQVSMPPHTHTRKAPAGAPPRARRPMRLAAQWSARGKVTALLAWKKGSG